jgi:hypothetical protein
MQTRHTHIKESTTTPAGANRHERIATPFGRVTLGCAKLEAMDTETLATIERGLTCAAEGRKHPA